jgi:hypothetical protein
VKENGAPWGDTFGEMRSADHFHVEASFDGHVTPVRHTKAFAGKARRLGDRKKEGKTDAAPPNTGFIAEVVATLGLGR